MAVEADMDSDYEQDLVFEMDGVSSRTPAKPPAASRSTGPSSSSQNLDSDEFNDDEDDEEEDMVSDVDVDLDEEADSRFRRPSQVLASSLYRNSLGNDAGALVSPSLPKGVFGISENEGALYTITAAGELVSYEVLSPEEICETLSEVVREVNQVLQLPATTVRLLLSQLNWDKERLMERYYDDSEKLFQDAHVASPAAGSSQERSSSRSGADAACDICFLPLGAAGAEVKATNCGHGFCGACWKTYLTGKILDENVAYTIECPAYDCHILVDDVFVMDVIKDTPNLRRRYQKGITNSFVESHRSLRWCPGTDCMYAIRVPGPDWMPVMCTHCFSAFCFLCGQPWHDPVTCAVLKRWMKKCADDSETSNWISANTKECPQCHATIEKDGGCNHVVCKNVTCKSEFCWICLGPWQPHGSSWFKCNRYAEDDAKAARDAQEKSRHALARYLFYFNRFMNHQQSLRLEAKLNSSIRQKMEEMQQHNMSWIEVQFLQKAVNTLQQCRQTLMYTYVFAFYLKKNNQQIIFEDNQHDLENATETLSGFLERDITGQNANEIKQKVQDKARYCEIRRRALIEHVHEGYDHDWWDFSSYF